VIPTKCSNTQRGDASPGRRRRSALRLPLRRAEASFCSHVEGTDGSARLEEVLTQAEDKVPPLGATGRWRPGGNGRRAAHPNPRQMRSFRHRRKNVREVPGSPRPDGFAIAQRRAQSSPPEGLLDARFRAGSENTFQELDGGFGV
jgi:hypothetical protein